MDPITNTIIAIASVGSAFLISYLLTPWFRDQAARIGLLDYPDGRRKNHRRPKPTAGGVVILIASVFGVFFACGALALWNGQSLSLPSEWRHLLFASLIITATGLLDDRLNLLGRQKLLGQVVATVVVMASGLRINSIPWIGYTVELGLLSYPLTFLCLLSMINALNLLDGADGFASTVGATILTTMGIISLVLAQPADAMVAFAIAGALLGFLRYNFPPSTIYLGDTGSMLLGLNVGVLAIAGHLKGPTTVMLTAPVALLLIPILDSSAAILRRSLSGRRLSSADRQHLHHVLQNKGFAQSRALAIVALLCGATGLGALLSVINETPVYSVLSILFVIGTLWANNMFGETEFALLTGRVTEMIGMILPSSFRRWQNHRIRIGLRNSRIVRSVWRNVLEFAEFHELSKVKLQIDATLPGLESTLWEQRFRKSLADNWRVQMPLSYQDHNIGLIDFRGRVSGADATDLTGKLSDFIESLGPQLASLVTHRGSRNSNLIFEQADIIGIKFDFVPSTNVIDVIQAWKDTNRRDYITLTNPHSVMLCQRDVEMGSATSNAGLTLPDGVGVVLAAKLLGYGRRHRVTGPALVLDVCDKGRDIGLKHFFYGGQEGIADELSRRMQERFPGLEVVGTYCPPFRELTSEEDEQIVEMINESGADILWVGLGAPKQEKWMARHAMAFQTTATIGVGAAFDFHTGNVRWAPWIFRKTGTEWLFRLAMEPGRLWRRNLDSPLFLSRVLKQLSSKVRAFSLGKLVMHRIRRIDLGPAGQDPQAKSLESETRHADGLDIRRSPHSRN